MASEIPLTKRQAVLEDKQLEQNLRGDWVIFIGVLVRAVEVATLIREAEPNISP